MTNQRTAFVKMMLPKIERASKQQMVLRWGITVLVLVLAGLGLWSWAWLTLALGAFAAFIDIGLALVVGQVNLAATSISNNSA
jgi:hypothetical protein